MSLMNMVTKVAIGFAVAKGMQKVQQSGGLGKIMESLAGAAGSAGASKTASSGGGLGGLLGGLTNASASGSGGLGGLLGSLGGAASGGAGGLGDLLGSLTGGASGASGRSTGSAMDGLSDLGNLGGGLGGIGGLLGGLASARGGSGGGSSLEDLLSQDNPAEEPAEEDTAGLMIRAMVMAARSDGEIDASEKETLMSTIGENATAEDMSFVSAALDAPVDASALAADTPKGVETQVYSMAVMAIEPSNQAEAKFLHELATSLGIQHNTANEIHDSFGVPRLYS